MKSLLHMVVAYEVLGTHLKKLEASPINMPMQIILKKILCKKTMCHEVKPNVQASTGHV
jgi:hypothetical protein